MAMGKFLALVPFAFALASCATTAESNDPSQGGFGNAVSGVLGGQYEERLSNRRADLDSERRRQMELNAVLAPLLAERDQLAVSIRQAETRIDAQSRRINELQHAIGQTQSVNTRQRARLDQLTHEYAELRDRASALDAYSRTSASVEIGAELDDISRNLDRLSVEFDQLAAGVG